MSIVKKINKIISKNLSEILALRNVKVSKRDGSYVTKGDLLSQKLIIDCIKLTNNNYQILSEEIDLDDFVYDKNADYAIVDPIDGTENFTSGLKEWGISISFFKHDKHCESAIIIPELGLSLMTGDIFIKQTSRIYALSSSLSAKNIANLKTGHEYRMMGCCVYNLYNVITGSFAVFENPAGANSWDIIAGLNLALEHSLNITVNGKKYTGSFLLPGRKYTFRIQNQNV